MKTVLITGATSGIGKATAIALAKKGYQLILCGRNQSVLEELKANLLTKVHICCFDVRDKNDVFNQIENLPDTFKRIDILINNAGNAHGLATFDKADLEDLEAMIDINVKGLIYVTKAVLPLMPENSESHIINISSIAGKEVYQNGTTYCASKFAVETLTKGMRIDLLPLGIKVTAIAPGAVETNFSLVRFKGDSEKANQVYSGYEPLTAEDISNSILFAIEQPSHVQIADITILPKAQASATNIRKD
ncbi:MAG TPA: SDR family NAD(P)-dependent oxidoreductase [Flavobacterium sp.]|nr:SDR family NAD(P)-dependent oxidoreductase [Flavobacterium sp.]